MHETETSENPKKATSLDKVPSGLDKLPSGLHLLMIEDVPEDIELVVLALEAAQLNFTYDTADTLDRCRYLLKTHTYDAIFSDYRLPSFNGLQAYHLLKESLQEIPFILITGSLGEESAVECIKIGMTDYVLKDRLFRLPMVLERALQEFSLRRQQKVAIAQIQQQAWREGIVNRIVQAMRKTLVLEEVLQTMVDLLQEALQVSHCLMFQASSEQTQRSHNQYLSHGSVEQNRLLETTCKLYEYYQDDLLKDQLVIIHEVSDSLPEPVQEIVKTYGIYSLIMIPLFYQKSYLGGICLKQCDHQRTWTQDEVTLVKAIADQCAIAIHQSKLYQQAQTELIERQRVEAQLRYNAFHDSLTGLPNRALFMDRLQHVMQLSQRRSERCIHILPYQFAVLFLDLDRFKVVNDSLGHSAGDQLLKLVAKQLQSCIRKGDVVARLSGDEFAILVEDIKNANDAVEVAERIHRELKAPIVLSDSELFVTVSIGIAIYSDNYSDPSQILRDADIAMYRAKRNQPGRYEIFHTPMYTYAIKQLQLERDLQRAIELQELRVYYQPIISLGTHRIEGFEALVRWQHPDQGIILPAEFIPIAEETGLILSLDFWVLHEACRQLGAWLKEFSMLPFLTMSVNLSGRQLSHSELISVIDKLLIDAGIPGTQLKLEITEGTLIKNPELASKILQQLRARFIQISLDDFGTGYSSLSYLHQFPIDGLKIDRSFITLLDTDQQKSEIVKVIVNLAQTLGLTVVAEGVETLRQMLYLQSVKCHFAQGYHFSHPLVNTDAAVLLQQEQLRLSSESG